MNFRRSSGGFALPTVLIASIVMLAVLLVAVTSTAAVRASLMSQYYDQLSRTAGDSGLAYAKACLALNNGVPLWTAAKPLTPSTDCTGTQLAGVSCPSDAHCSVVRNSTNNVNTTFSVGMDQAPLPSSWKMVSSGSSHTCAITIADLAYCWGNNGSGQLGNGTKIRSLVPTAIDMTGVLSGKTIKSISSGASFTCVIANDDLVYCWGKNNSGQLGINSTDDSLTPVAVDRSGVLGGGKTIKSLSVGDSHACVIASDNNAYCWGSDYFGQLGNDAATDNSLVPVAVSTAVALSGKTIKSISSGESHTCVIASDNLAYCWGRGGGGQLGNNSSTDSGVPVAVDTTNLPGDKTIKAISSGTFHTCAIASNDNAYCWGDNTSGKLGDNSTNSTTVPVAVYTAGVLNGKTIKYISTGLYFTCVVASDNLAYCWGSNDGGTLGDNSTNQSSVAVLVYTAGVLSGKTITSISSAKMYHTCVTTSDNAVYCWGEDSSGQLGNNSTTYSSVPVAISAMGILENIYSASTTSLSRSSDSSIWRQYNLAARMNLIQLSLTGYSLYINQITSRGWNNCAIASDNNAYCWGNNGNGQLGNNSTTSSSVPVAVSTATALNGKTVKFISAGLYHSCAIASDDKAYCWGGNLNGQLGNNSIVQSNVPVAVNTTNLPGDKTVKAISSSSNHTCAIASNNKAYCWGFNGYGQLGNNSTTESLVPVAVSTTNLPGDKTVKAISTGRYHTCAIASDDKAYCWGNNGYGQLGDNSTTDRYVPVAVSVAGVLSGKTIKYIAVGYSHTCVTTSEDKSYCWGYNAYGQIGDNSTADRHIPVAVSVADVFSDKTVIAITAGSYHTCAIASNNLPYCWGRNGNGQIGDNSTTDRLVPVAVITGGALNSKTIKAISAGLYHTCTIASDDLTYCWGKNELGEVGDGTTTQRLVPVATTTLTNSMRSIGF